MHSVKCNICKNDLQEKYREAFSLVSSKSCLPFRWHIPVPPASAERAAPCRLPALPCPVHHVALWLQGRRGDGRRGHDDDPQAGQEEEEEVGKDENVEIIEEILSIGAEIKTDITMKRGELVK